MKKTVKTKIVAISFTTVLILSGITVFASTQHKSIFKDINGNNVTVLTQEEKEFLNNKSIDMEMVIPNDEKVEVGQTIKVNGEDVIVFAVGEDGAYITVTPDVFYEFQNSK